MSLYLISSILFQEMVNLLKILLKRNQNLKLRVLRSQLWGRRANLLTRKRTRKKTLKSILSCDNTYSERRFEVDGLQICWIDSVISDLFLANYRFTPITNPLWCPKTPVLPFSCSVQADWDNSLLWPSEKLFLLSHNNSIPTYFVQLPLFQWRVTLCTLPQLCIKWTGVK